MSTNHHLKKTQKGPKWKRELSKEHKFDNIDLRAFQTTNCITMLRYLILLCSIVISFLVYIADLWTAVTLLVYDKWSLIEQPIIPFYISKWIYVGCIALSFLLLAWEIRNTVKVMDTRDVSLAVTNPLAYRTYSAKGYKYFCLLRKIKSSTKWSDVIIFYVFYTLKGWKKVIVAQAPRQIIAGMTVYALLYSAWNDQKGHFHFATDWDVYGADWQQRVTLISMSFTCILWVLSALSILLAIFLYFFVLCQIQGNLKEYCCHKIDKRIDEILENQARRDRSKHERNQTYIQETIPKDQETKFEQMEHSTTPIIRNKETYQQGGDEDSIWQYYDYNTTPSAPQKPNEMHSYQPHHHQPNPYNQPEMHYDWQAQSNQASGNDPSGYAYYYDPRDNYGYPAHEPQAPYQPTHVAYGYQNNQGGTYPSDYQHYADTFHHQQYTHYKA
ncbi:hypothetical protein EDC96DRAFT_516058 [Choanephora cucurbitarum]|nr:hypothetical protein EDC96DRAFT_516058 [Choanephora cucurbitarum]